MTFIAINTILVFEHVLSIEYAYYNIIYNIYIIIEYAYIE